MKKNIKNIDEIKKEVESHLNKVDRLSESDAKFNEIHLKSIDISNDYVYYVCKRIYDLLKDFEEENNCFIENKNYMPLRRSLIREITRIALIPFEKYVVVICFLYKKGYKEILFQITDTEPYHDYLVRMYKQNQNK